jgi:hypothetical protein
MVDARTQGEADGLRQRNFESSHTRMPDLGINFNPPMTAGLAEVVVMVAWAIVATGVFCILYPLTVVTALAAVAVTMAGIPFVVSKDTTWLSSILSLASLALGAVTLRVASYVEQRLTDQHTYRLIRHVLRLAILAGLLIGAMAAPSARSTVWNWSTARSTVEHASPLAALVGVLGLIATHFFLWRSRIVRRAWHQKLEKWGFRGA